MRVVVISATSRSNVVSLSVYSQFGGSALPWAFRIFKCEKAWRFWSEAEAGVHYAAYQFPDMVALEAALAREEFKELVADFNRAWPDGVTRTWDKVTLAEEREAS